MDGEHLLLALLGRPRASCRNCWRRIGVRRETRGSTRASQDSGGNAYDRSAKRSSRTSEATSSGRLRQHEHLLLGLLDSPSVSLKKISPRTASNATRCSRHWRNCAATNASPHQTGGKFQLWKNTPRSQGWRGRGN